MACCSLSKMWRCAAIVQAVGASADDRRNVGRRRRTAPVIALVAAVLVALPAGAEERRNWFGDPFERATDGLRACPEPEPPLLTEAQRRAEAHYRAERGTSCYQSGRCRLPNAYLYDKEIVPRVVKAIRADGRFAATSIWVEGQRRWVWLKGCVSSADQKAALEQLARSVDDVEAVIDQLQLGTDASPPPYRRPAP